MLRNDGKFEIFIIQHKRIKDKTWSRSGQCEQFIPKDIIKELYDELFYHDSAPFKPFSANGSCWQETGVHGSFDYHEAYVIFNHIISWNPGHEFRICKISIEQKTEEVVEGYYSI